MPSIINTNIASINAQRNLNGSQGALNTSLQRLSSGLRVNSAKDDAAGLAIATRMTSQSRGMDVAIRNTNDGISLAQTAEGALSTIKDHLLRMRDLAVQSANATNSSADRSQLDKEFKQVQQEVQRIVAQTTFNGSTILSGAGAGQQNFQVGAASGDQVSITTSDMLTGANGLSGAVGSGNSTSSNGAVSISGGVTITGATDATGAITAIDDAINKLGDERAIYGAAQNRFEGISSMLQTAKENTEAATSRIMDTDYASETAKMTRSQVLQQAGVAMLAQANSLPNNVMSLLR